MGKQNQFDMVISGDCIFIMMIDDPQKAKKCSDCCDKWDKGFAGTKGNFPSKVEEGVQNAIKGCGLCYYKVCKKKGKFPNAAKLQN